MPSVLITVFFAQLLIHVINTLIGSTLNDLLWMLYSNLPAPHSNDAAATNQLRRDVVRLAREMGAVSAQDDFAKWARLRREHDKAKASYDKQSAVERDFRTTFDRIVGALRFLFTQGLNFGINSWNSKQPIFWLPQGWVPYQVEWILSCPSAPLGSVSVNVWGFACGSVIAMISEATRSSITLRSSTVPIDASKGEKMSHSISANTSAANAKKEL